jgi:stress-induced morphogen
MGNESLRSKIHDVLKHGHFKDPDDMVDVSFGPEDSLHVVVVSRKFDGRRMKEKHDLIWSELTQPLQPDEWQKVSLSIGCSPEEIKAM